MFMGVANSDNKLYDEEMQVGWCCNQQQRRAQFMFWWLIGLTTR